MESLIDIIRECSARLGKQTFGETSIQLRQVIQAKIQEKNRVLHNDIRAKIEEKTAKVDLNGQKQTKIERKRIAKLTNEDYLRAYSVKNESFNNLLQKRKARLIKRNILNKLILECQRKNRRIFKLTEVKNRRKMRRQQRKQGLLNCSEKKEQQLQQQDQIKEKKLDNIKEASQEVEPQRDFEFRDKKLDEKLNSPQEISDNGSSIFSEEKDRTDRNPQATD